MTEVTGNFPPAPEIPMLYHRWQAAYHQLGGMRIKLPATQVTHVSSVEDCEQAAHTLREAMNRWLNQESVRDLREHLLEEVGRKEAVRVILQTTDRQLQQLPWHLWDLLERRPLAEIALSTEYGPPGKPLQGKVRILAILGDSANIDVEADRRLLQQLPAAQVTLLDKPQRQQLNEQLWQQPWDILFFAGHSFSVKGGQGGEFSLMSMKVCPSISCGMP